MDDQQNQNELIKELIKKKRKGKKGCIITVIVVFCFLSLIMGCIFSFGIPETNKLSDNAKTIKEICNVTEEQALAIEEILGNCEITTIDNLEHDDMLDDMFNSGDTGYRLQSQGIKNIILYLNSEKEVLLVRHADIEMFSENTYKTKFSSFYLTTSQATKLQIFTQNMVNSTLVSPSSAEFPSITKWNFDRSAKTNMVTIASYVDSQNAFGAMIRSDFVVLYKITGDIEQGQFSLVYFEIDNKIVVDNR